jgi:hypothetical protein
MEAVAQAIGRNITQEEAVAIESRVRRAMTERARLDPEAWRSMTEADRLHAGAAGAAQQLLREASKAKQRTALTIVAHDKVMNRYQTLVAEGNRPFKAVSKVLDDASRYAKGVTNEYFSGLIDALDAVHPKWLGVMERADQAAALVREIFGEQTGNKEAAKGAKAWLETNEALRQRFNAAGGDIGELNYSHIPQPHDDLRVLRAGQEQWVKDILPKLDRSRYVDDFGNRLDDAQMTFVLESVWETITTGGLNKLEPGVPEVGIRADRGSKARFIHFKDAEAYLTYMTSYGRGGVLSAMQSHVARMAKDIALVEEFGPNPEAQFRFLHDTARKIGGYDLVGPWAVSTNNMWDVLNGHTASISNPKLAEVAQGVRNIEVFGKLGSAFLSSITDIPTYFVTAKYNRLGFGETLTNLIRAFGGNTREYANRAGLVAESVMSDMNRWAEGNIGRGWTAKLSNATMKASLLEAWTNAIRRGFSVTMMGALGKMSRGEWSALHESDRARLMRQGVTETDFKVWKLATPESWNGSDMLTVQALRNLSETDLAAAGLTLRDQNRAVSKLLGAIVDESEYASLNQDLQTRAAATRGTQKGSIEGELLRSAMLFKGFPMAMISRHWGRMADTWNSGGRVSAVGYGASLITSLTVFGALALQLKDLRDGKDPRDMDSFKFWLAAFSQGGGGGIFGDFLFSNQNRFGNSFIATLMGPVAGDLEDMYNLTVGNAHQAASGEDTHIGAEGFQFAKSHLPFINLWYAKAVIDHAVLQDIQEYLSPGYLDRIRERAYTDWEQEYWWQPGETLPERAPRL